MIKTGVSFIPAIGPIVEKTASLAQMALDEMQARRTWTAALMRLRPTGGDYDPLHRRY